MDVSLEVIGAIFDDWSDHIAPLAALLDEDEIATASRRHTESLRARYITAHAVTRIAIAARLGLTPEALVFERLPCVHCGGAHGRPVLVDRALHFSLAHCDDRALIATSSEHVGVDIECQRDVRDPAELARNIADENEQSCLGRDSSFLELWVRKEALVKATGEGLLAAKKYSFASGDPEGWSIPMLDVGQQHVAALAVPTRYCAPTPPTVRWLRPPPSDVGS